MRVVQYLRSFASADGGVVRAVIDLANAMAARGHDVIVLSADRADAPQAWDGRERRPLLRILAANRVLPRWLSAHSLRLGRDALDQACESINGADVLHLHVPWDPICVQLARLAQGINVPHIVSVHGMLDDWTMAHKSAKKKLFLRLGGRGMLEGAAAVQFSSRIEAEQSQRRFACRRAVVVPLLFDTGPFERLPGSEQARGRFLPPPARDAPIILYLGRLHPIKRIELLLEAASLLRRVNDQFHLVIAGTGENHYEQQLQKRVATHGLANSVSFAGFVGGGDKLSLYQAATVVVNPSAHESFGLASIEALACGTPVIVTRSVNIWPELEQSGAATIVEANPQAMCEGIRSILQSREGARNAGLGGRQWIFDYFQADRVARLYEQVYADAAHESRRTSTT